MDNNIIYIVQEDDDYGTIKIFKNKHNAIDYMYHEMVNWGCILMAPPKKRFGNLINLHTEFPEEDGLMTYLYERNENELKYIFGGYFTYSEATFED